MREVFNKYRVFPKEYHDEKYFKELPNKISASNYLNVDFVNMRDKLDFLFNECDLTNEDKIKIHNDFHELLLALVDKLKFGYFKTKKIKKFNKKFPDINYKDRVEYYLFFCELFNFDKFNNDVEILSNYYSCLIDNKSDDYNLKSYIFLSQIEDYTFYKNLEYYIFKYLNVTKDIIFTEDDYFIQDIINY